VLDAARAKKDTLTLEMELAESRLREAELHVRIYSMEVQQAKQKLEDANVNFSRIQWVIRQRQFEEIAPCSCAHRASLSVKQSGGILPTLPQRIFTDDIHVKWYISSIYQMELLPFAWINICIIGYRCCKPNCTM
jgi:hypothetical protein